MNMDIPRYGWKGLEIAPVFSMMVEGGNYEDVPLGIFTIDSAKHTASGIVVKAYDNMSKLDKTCSTIDKRQGLRPDAYRLHGLRGKPWHDGD